MIRALFFLIVACIVASLVFAAGSATSSKETPEQNKESSPASPKAKRAKDMTAQELADGITKALNRSKDVINYIPGFKKEKDPEGKDYYTYKEVALEKMDKEALAALYGRVRQERNRLNTERINRQLANIQQAQQAANIANQASRIPKVPVLPAQPPKAPPAPPPVPKR